MTAASAYAVDRHVQSPGLVALHARVDGRGVHRNGPAMLGGKLAAALIGIEPDDLLHTHCGSDLRGNQTARSHAADP